jgi:cytochrome P450
MDDPYPMYDELRAKCPVGRSRQHGGFVFAATYDEAKAVLSDFRHFSSANGIGLPARPIKLFPVDVDPPEQVRFRRILNPHFTPEAAEALRPRVETLVDDLIDGFIERGACELGDDLVRPTLPATLLPVLGIPLEDLNIFFGWVETTMRRRVSDPEGVVKAAASIHEYVLGVIAAHRALPEPRPHNVLNSLMTQPFDGRILSDDEIARTLMIIINGALDTTTVGVLEALLYLSRHPEDAQRLRSGEFDYKVAIEELLRCFCPVTVMGRTVTEDTELGGLSLRAGEFIMAMNGAANRDPRQFPDAALCALDRQDNPHLSFGQGAHICLGRHIARMEIECFLKAVLTRMPDFHTEVDWRPEWDIFQGRAMKHLPVTFTPGRRLKS